jgi:hypothetical protein
LHFDERASVCRTDALHVSPPMGSEMSPRSSRQLVFRPEIQFESRRHYRPSPIAVAAVVARNVPANSDAGVAYLPTTATELARLAGGITVESLRKQADAIVRTDVARPVSDRH